MNVAVKMVLVLTGISLITGGVLQTWEGFTAPLVEQHRQEELKAAIKEVLPPHDRYEEKKANDITLYAGYHKNETGNEELVGYAVNMVGSGFQGKISLMLGLDPSLKNVTGMKILGQTETPGLGTKIEDDPSNKTNRKWFTEQFKGIVVDPAVEYVKNQKPSKENEIQAITGATISSRSTVNIVNDWMKKIRAAFPEISANAPSAASNPAVVSTSAKEGR